MSSVADLARIDGGLRSKAAEDESGPDVIFHGCVGQEEEQQFDLCSTACSSPLVSRSLGTLSYGRSCASTPEFPSLQDSEDSNESSVQFKAGLEESEDVINDIRTFCRQCSPLSDMKSQTTASVPFSDAKYGDPAQTLIIFDWDDTLFPTTQLCEAWGVKCNLGGSPFVPKDPQQAQQLSDWQQAIKEYLTQACLHSDQVTIVTNSRRPWVSQCIDTLCPDLRELFDRPTKAPKVVYAREHLKKTRTHRSQCLDLRPVRNRVNDYSFVTEEELTAELSMAKFQAIRQEAKAFYTQYPNQSWKNILSFGDMNYERDAVKDVTFRRVPPKSTEKIRTKTFTLPTCPSLTEITMRLQFSALLLPAYVAFDGDLDIDLQEASDPLEVIANAMQMPELARLSLSRHAWGCEALPECPEEVSQALAELAVVVHDHLYT